MFSHWERGGYRVSCRTTHLGVAQGGSCHGNQEGRPRSVIRSKRPLKGRVVQIGCSVLRAEVPRGWVGCASRRLPQFVEKTVNQVAWARSNSRDSPLWNGI